MSDILQKSRGIYSQEDRVLYLESAVEMLTNKRKKNKASFDKRVRDFESIMQWIEHEIEVQIRSIELDPHHRVHRYREQMGEISKKHPNVASWYAHMQNLVQEIVPSKHMREVLSTLPLESLKESRFNPEDERE